MSLNSENLQLNSFSPAIFAQWIKCDFFPQIRAKRCNEYLFPLAFHFETKSNWFLYPSCWLLMLRYKSIAQWILSEIHSMSRLRFLYEDWGQAEANDQVSNHISNIKLSVLPNKPNNSILMYEVTDLIWCDVITLYSISGKF